MTKLDEKFPLIKLFSFPESIYYIYDGRVNIFLRLNAREWKIILKYINLCVKSEEVFATESLSSSDLKFIDSLNRQGILICGPLAQRVNCSAENISDVLEQSRTKAITRKLTIEVTTGCNLRCKYCPYTINEILETGKKHGYSRINSEKAKLAILKYFQSYTSILEKVKCFARDEINLFLDRNPPAIGFYGGEALLEYPLVKELVMYIESLPWERHGIPLEKIMINVTTNGTLLTKEIIEFCILHKIFLSISFDGPPEENDKNRVFKNGHGSGKVVEKALDLIKDMSNDYLLHHVKIQAVMAPEYNSADVYRYFEDRSCESHYAGVSLFSFLEYTDYQNQEKISPSTQNLNIIEYIKSIYNEEISIEELTGVINHNPWLKTWLKFVYEILVKVNDIPQINENFFNSCFIGKAGLFVDTKGLYHLCERSDFSIPIGDIHSGKNEDTIARIYSEYFKVMDSKECRNCWAAHFCTLCIAALIKEGHVVAPHNWQCDNIRSSMEAQIKDLLCIKNFYPKILLCMDNMYAQTNDITIDNFWGYINLD